MEARFADLCKNGLSLDENAYEEVLKLFNETKQLLSANVATIGSGTVEEAERFWFAFVLYSVKRLSERNGENVHQGTDDRFNLCQILRVAKLNIVDFFKELPQFVVKAGPLLSSMFGADWESRLEAKELQANFVHLSLLSKYYKRVYQEFFLASDGNVEKKSVAASANVYVSDYHRFGWLLFLALRVHAFSRFKDLVTCTNGLVSILAILIIHVPIRFRNFNIQDSSCFVKKGDKGVDLLASLCNIYDTSEEELRKTMEKANDLIASLLKKKPCSASECQTENLENIDPYGLTYFEDLMNETSLTSSLSILEKDYDEAIRSKGELDERVFINEEDSLLGSGSLSGGVMNITGVKRKLDSLTSPAKTISSPFSPLRSPAYNRSGIGVTVARPALAGEITRLGLLAEPMPSLDAIAMHINFSSGSLPPVPSSQKHEISLGQNGDIKSPKRLCTDFRSVLVERNSFTSPVKDRLLTLSQTKSKMPPPPLQSAFASPTRPNPGGGGETFAETGMSIFFTKINKLAAVRINGMVERLQLSQQMRESVYCLFQKILSQRTSLFFNRHIDQIILCCFYGVAKISQLNLTFREIIYNYRKQPHCKPQVFRSVFIDSASARRSGRAWPDHVDIITFYNEVFIPVVKPLLVELGPVGTAMKSNRVPEANAKSDGPCPGSPKISPFPSLPDMSPKKVSAAHNVYVSPLRSSKMDALISHSAKSYYACVGESTHAYQSPSKDLTAINNRLNSTRKVRGALNFDDPDVGLVSDSMVANSLYLQTGSCASSSGAPVKFEQADS
ncbi:retinoblastoma-related protein [Carica papaya]|uniref:retinoblastoma-related protein n=1 Tax=Carica papaya TaxID=3649 RepID=UPI000B8CB667|nr:retinoblastoma-related protein [Carica papaya]